MLSTLSRTPRNEIELEYHLAMQESQGLEPGVSHTIEEDTAGFEENTLAHRIEQAEKKLIDYLLRFRESTCEYLRKITGVSLDEITGENLFDNAVVEALLEKQFQSEKLPSLNVWMRKHLQAILLYGLENPFSIYTPLDAYRKLNIFFTVCSVMGITSEGFQSSFGDELWQIHFALRDTIEA